MKDIRNRDEHREVERDADWTGQVRRLLDAQAERFDAATLQRLNRARATALAARHAPPRWRLPLGAAAASATVLMLALALGPTSRPVAPLPAPTSETEDTALLVGDDALDLYQDLEFYAWLDARDADNG